MGFLASACAEVSHTGPRAYSKLPGDFPVTVFTSPAEAPARFEDVAIILYPDSGRPESYDITSSLNTIRAKARDFGGNGVIIDAKEEATSGFFAGGTLVRARAIRFGALLGQGVDPASGTGDEFAARPQGKAHEALVELQRLRRQHLIDPRQALGVWSRSVMVQP